jgi:phage terminase large subunit-like protein
MTSIKPSLLQRNFWMKWPLEKRAAFRARADWLLKARPAQLTPPGEWRIWLVKAGRGWGKSRVGAEDAAYFGLWNDGVRQAVIAPTHADARDVCVEGDSGLLKVIPPECVETWNRSMGELILKNGSRFKLFSADEPERLRGPQFHRVWVDLIDVPLDEDAELYDLDILNGVNVVRSFSALTLPSVSYTAAQQITDFGSVQASVSVAVYQLSSRYGRGQEAQATI